MAVDSAEVTASERPDDVQRPQAPRADSGGAPPRRRRVALIGHPCSPILGSEPGFTWNWATRLSAYHDVTVYANPLYRAHVDAELAVRPRENLRIVWVELDHWDPWDDAKGERGVRIHYNLWQRKVLKVVRRASAERPFDLVHHVSWG